MRTIDRFESHAWVELNGVALTDDRDVHGNMKDVFLQIVTGASASIGAPLSRVIRHPPSIGAKSVTTEFMSNCTPLLTACAKSPSRTSRARCEAGNTFDVSGSWTRGIASSDSKNATCSARPVCTPSSDPDGSVASQSWDFDDDGAFDDAKGATATWEFWTPGVYTVRHPYGTLTLSATAGERVFFTEDIGITCQGRAPGDEIRSLPFK